MTLNKKLSARRRQILDYIHNFYQENGLPPTVRDIQKACDISSTSVVDYNLRLLDRDGYLNRRPEVARGIELLDETGRAVSTTPRIPIVGRIAAGLPLPVFSVEDSASSQEFDTIEIAPELQRRYGQLFGLTVEGTSMIDALIADGDIVIVKPADTVKNGDTVVAWLKKENEATLKKFYHEGDRIRLQPANRQMEPIYVSPDNLDIQGKVITVLRDLA